MAHLQALPPELLVIILEHALVSDSQLILLRSPNRNSVTDGGTGLTLEGKSGQEYPERSSSSTLAGPVRVNKAFYAVGRPIYYGDNKFYFDSVQSLDTFIGTIDNERKRMIKNIVVRMVYLIRDDPPNPAGFSALLAPSQSIRQLRNLERVDVKFVFQHRKYTGQLEVRPQVKARIEAAIRTVLDGVPEEKVKVVYGDWVELEGTAG